MKFLSKLLYPFAGLMGVLLLAGCSAYANNAQVVDIPVKRVHSRIATIDYARVQRETTGLVLRGEIQSRSPTRLPLPGYMQVELLTAEGKVFKQTRIGYHKLGIKSNRASFALAIPFKQSQFAQVRVTHVELRVYPSKEMTAPWSDAGPQ
ncbi:MAG: hypothetical protein GC149_13345 [Gammaproteobacteria bacterium]|nr:hypothetical protein [Gammaproteobacteria bacterium]